VPVRIIFRGLILFHFPESGDNAGKLVACLINNPDFTGGIDESSKPHKGHGKWEHDHSAEIQILSDEDAPKHDPKPVRLDPGVNVDIIVPGGDPKPVSTAQSFDRHVPNLQTIIDGATDEIKNAGRQHPGNRKLIQNVVTVDRGVAHVKKVINWDEDGYPLRGNRAVNRGGRPGAPVRLKFMGSTVQGHMASEVVVEIDDVKQGDDVISAADEIKLRTKDKNGKVVEKLNDSRKGPVRPNHRVPIGSVEVLVTNYEFRRDDPVAWGLDYQWLFETVGFGAAPLGGEEFTRWSAFARRYDLSSFESETDLLLGGPDNPIGRPFPYIESVRSLAPVKPMADDYNPPVCAFGQTGIKLP
jgi:hypothetical protein